MRRFVAGVVLTLLALVVPPARGQAPESGEWSPREVRPVESAGEVVLRFTRFHPGRTVYYTSDGDCYGYPSAEDMANPTPVSPGYCRRPLARAGEDYGAVRGEWIFTEAGSRTITISIIDDDLDEAEEETFTIIASQHDDVAGTTKWYSRDIRIKDDDSPAMTAPPATTAGGRSSGSSAANAIPGSDNGDAALGRSVTASVTPTAAVGGGVSNDELQPGSGSKLASGDLQPGPGFALTSDGSPQPARRRAGGGGGSWFAFGLGAATMSLGAIALARRRLRWSPTRV